MTIPCTDVAVCKHHECSHLLTHAVANVAKSSTKSAIVEGAIAIASIMPIVASVSSVHAYTFPH